MIAFLADALSRTCCCCWRLVTVSAPSPRRCGTWCGPSPVAACSRCRSRPRSCPIGASPVGATRCAGRVQRRADTPPLPTRPHTGWRRVVRGCKRIKRFGASGDGRRRTGSLAPDDRLDHARIPHLAQRRRSRLILLRWAGPNHVLDRVTGSPGRGVAQLARGAIAGAGTPP